MPKSRNAHEQRHSLVQAALELAEKLPTAQLTPKAIAAHAGLPQRSIASHFASPDGLLAVLQEQHNGEIRDHTLSALVGHQPGIERLLVASSAYLDFAFARRGLRAWISDTRARSPAMERRWRMDNLLYAQFAASELSLSGWPQPLAGARLFIAGMLELARHEQRAGRKLPGGRRAIEKFLRCYERYPGGIS